MTDEARSLSLKPLRELGARGVVTIDDFFTGDLNVYVDFDIDTFLNARGARQQIRKALNAQDLTATIKVKRVGFFRSEVRQEVWRAKLVLHR